MVASQLQIVETGAQQRDQAVQGRCRDSQAQRRGNGGGPRSARRQGCGRAVRDLGRLPLARRDAGAAREKDLPAEQSNDHQYDRHDQFVLLDHNLVTGRAGHFSKADETKPALPVRFRVTPQFPNRSGSAELSDMEVGFDFSSIEQV